MSKELNPETIVYFDGKHLPLREARVSILTHALNYGTGVFEGIRGYWDEGQQELFLVRAVEHYARWKKNCGILQIQIPHSPEELAEMTVELILTNQFRSDVYVRPLAYMSSPRIGVHPDGKGSFALIVLPFGVYLDSSKGIHAGVSSWRRVEDNAIPGRAKICGAYVNSALASDEARRNGFDEAIVLNESGHVAEGAACNIFLVRDGRLITPPGTENILEGITRATVLELARKELHIDIEERPVDRTELYISDEVFFTGTAVEVAPITRIDHRPVGNGEIGPVTRSLQELYTDASHGRLLDYDHWVCPVYQCGPDMVKDKGKAA